MIRVAYIGSSKWVPSMRSVSNRNVTDTSSLSESTDQELMALIAKHGDTEALGVIYDRYHQVVLNRAWGLLKEKTQAEDLTHDIFLKLFMNAEKYKADGSFSSWFGVLSYNVVMDALRQRKQARFVELEEDRLDSATDEAKDAVEEKQLFEVQLSSLMEALNALTIEDRTILLMKYQDGLSIEEISGILSIGHSAVKMRLMRARGRVLSDNRTQDL